MLNDIIKNKTCTKLEWDYNFGETSNESLYAATNSYFVWFNLHNRDRITLLNKINKNVKTIYFDKSILDMMSLDGPRYDNWANIRILSKDDNTLYFIIMKHNVIQIYKLTI